MRTPLIGLWVLLAACAPKAAPEPVPLSVVLHKGGVLVEGGYAIAEVEGKGRPEVWREYSDDAPSVSIGTVAVVPGTYTVRAWTHGCDGACDGEGEHAPRPAWACEERVEVRERTEVQFFIGGGGETLCRAVVSPRLP